MRHVMVMNSKGGCGKSTIATNVATISPAEGYKMALADYDPQRTSLDWLALRPRICRASPASRPTTRVCAACRATPRSWSSTRRRARTAPK